MNLPGLPKTKPALLARAEKEAWHYETKVGLGGVRKMFAIPPAYLPGYQPLPPEGPAATKAPTTNVVGTIAAGSAEVDPEMLEAAVIALEEWAQEKGIVIPPDRKAAIIAVLYDYLVKGAGEEEIARFMRAVG